MGVSILEKKKNETTYQYIKRIVQAKDDGELDLDYAELAPHLFGQELSSCEARKRFYGLRYLISVIENEGISLQPTSQLEQIKKEIGILDVKRQEVKNKYGKLNQLKKQFIKAIEISNDIKDEMFANGFQISIPNHCFKRIEYETDRKMIVTISDWHIGYVIHNCKGNIYNYEIANRRVDKYIDEIYKTAQLYNINKIIVINLGDVVEHQYLRGNQGQNTEFNQSEQINYALRLIYRFLTALTEFASVEYYGIAGNHDRSCGDKSLNIEGDNANTIIQEQLKVYNEISQNPRLIIADMNYLDREIVKEVNGVKFKFIHGDGKLKDPKRLYDSESTMDKEMFDCIVRGHWHNFSVNSQNGGGKVVNVGCLSGYNDYSARFGCSTYASQCIFVIGSGEIEIIKDVNLQQN